MSNSFSAGWLTWRLEPLSLARRGDAIPTKLTFLYVNIGRGHPFYLDGIIDVLNRSGWIRFVRGSEDVENIATGLSRLGWKAVRATYRLGASPGIVGQAYNSLRQKTDHNGRGLTHLLLGKDLRRSSATSGPVIVSHPMVVGMLRGHQNLFYQHGEAVAPEESIVTGATYVIVPTEDVAARFQAAGYTAEQMIISGLCIEPSLVRQAHDSYRLRLARLKDVVPLTGAFFSSGAEPPEHVRALVAAALSAVASEQRVFVFAHTRGYLARTVTAAFLSHHLPLLRVDASSPIPADLPSAVLVEYTTRREETHLTSKLFSWFDYFVAPSHERTNWALGLGLPMFILDPPIGSFAPLNRALLLERAVALPISSAKFAQSFSTHLQSARYRGTLTDMAGAGWGVHDINGFQNIADRLAVLLHRE